MTITPAVHIGIDPGLTGAIAVLANNYTPLAAIDMPVMPVSATGVVKNAIDPCALADFLRKSTSGVDPKAVNVYIERVSAFPGQGVAGMFSLGGSYWGAYCVAAVLGFNVHRIEPKEWKKFFHLTKDKDESLEIARRLFPSMDLSLKKHHGRGEALLIAQFGKSTCGESST